MRFYDGMTPFPTIPLVEEWTATRPEHLVTQWLDYQWWVNENIHVHPEDTVILSGPYQRQEDAMVRAQEILERHKRFKDIKPPRCLGEMPSDSVSQDCLAKFDLRRRIRELPDTGENPFGNGEWAGQVPVIRNEQ